MADAILRRWLPQLHSPFTLSHAYDPLLAIYVFPLACLSQYQGTPSLEDPLGTCVGSVLTFFQHNKSNAVSTWTSPISLVGIPISPLGYWVAAFAFVTNECFSLSSKSSVSVVNVGSSCSVISSLGSFWMWVFVPFNSGKFLYSSSSLCAFWSSLSFCTSAPSICVPLSAFSNWHFLFSYLLPTRSFKCHLYLLS